MKRIRYFHKYIFCRLLLFQRKQWSGNKALASFNSHGAVTLSAIAFVFSADFIMARIIGADFGYIDSGLKIGIVCAAMALITHRLFPGDDETLIEKYSDQKESDPLWKVKGFLSISVLLFPIILLLCLM